MGLNNNISVQDIMQTVYSRHKHTFNLVYGVFSQFQVILTLFALIFFGGLIFMTVWLRIKAQDKDYFSNGHPGSQDMKIFSLWLGSRDIFVEGLQIMLTFAVAAITIIPIMDQVKVLS